MNQVKVCKTSNRVKPKRPLIKKLIPFNERQTSIQVDIRSGQGATEDGHYNKRWSPKESTKHHKKMFTLNGFPRFPLILEETPSVWSCCAPERRGVKTGVHYIASHIFRPQNQTQTIWK